MSSIVIQGDTSGSITVEAPSVAGTHTLTLPKATGNIATDATVGLGTKNLIINGNFNIWQRNTNSGSVGSSGYWAADRWWSSIGAGATSMTLSQQTFTAGQTDVPYEPTYFHRYTQTGTSTGAGNFHQRIENVRTAAGQTVTLSFYAKANANITINTWANQNFGSGGSTTVSTSVTPHSVTTSWQKFTHTISIPSISGKTIGSNSYLRIYFGTPIGAGFDFDIALVQLELGENATPFEQRMYSQELAMCQRYYCKSYDTTTAPATNTSNGINIIGGSTQASGYQYMCLVFPQDMRTTPSITFYRDNGADNTWEWRRSGASGTIAPVAPYGSTRQMQMYVNAGGAYVVSLVWGHWVASAEL